MAATALGYDESTGMVRWLIDGQEAFLPVGQDPNPAPELYGWNPNMAVPAGGFTLGQLLAPNYLSQGTTLDDPAALAAAARDVAPGYTGPLDMNAVVPNNQVRAPAKDNGFENLLGAGAMAGLGFLSGGFGIPELWGNLFGSPATITSASGANPNLVGGSFENGMDWLNTDWGTEGRVDLGSSGYDAVASKDPIGALIQNLESGMTPSQAVSAVETALPGTTRSALEQFLYETAVNSGNGISRLLGNSLGGQSASGLFGGSGSDSNSLLGLLGKLSPSLLGMYASNQQANKLSELAQKYQDFGAPYRQQLADISANPDNFYNSLGAQKATDAVLNKLSIGGNPAGSANKQALTIDSLYDQYGKERDRLAGFGGLTNYNQAAPQLETQAIGANANMWNAAGAGLNDIFNPKTSLADLLKQGKIA